MVFVFGFVFDFVFGSVFGFVVGFVFGFVFGLHTDWFGIRFWSWFTYGLVWYPILGLVYIRIWFGIRFGVKV